VRDLFQRIRDEDKRIVLASSGKKADTKYYIDLLKIGNLIEATPPATMPTILNRQPTSLPRHWKSLAAFHMPML